MAKPIVTPLTLHIGARIDGVDLTQPLDENTVHAIRAALLKWKVVFFRDQKLDHAQHINFARYFGAPTPGHVVFGSDETYPEIYSVAKHRTANARRAPVIDSWTNWHTDVTPAINPPFASILRGVVVPPFGGDTFWSNAAKAYQTLSPTMQSFIETLRCVHRFAQAAGANEEEDQKISESGEYKKRTRTNAMISEHPLVIVHPETAERVLYVSPDFVDSIVGLSPTESRALLEMLWRHLVRNEFTVRFKWEEGSIAFWDNRATAHLAPADIFESDFDRQFYRVTLQGEVPVGVDGKPSSAISGNPIEAV